jgi:purine-binding chemotaxis protein CheW
LSETKDRTVVVFNAGGDRFALDVEAVREVLDYADPRPVEGLPDFLAGVLEVRGVVLPVFDLRPRLSDDDGGAAPADGRILALDSGGAIIGGIVDRVEDVRTIPASDVKRRPPKSPRHVAASVIHGGGRAALLKAEALLSDEERRALIGE